MSPQMKSLQLWQKVGLVRVTFLRQWPGAELWYLGRRPGDCCALFFPVRGLAVRLSAASGSAGLARPESAMSYTNSDSTGETGFPYGAEKPRALENIPPPEVRHPTGPDTAAQPGDRAPCSVCIPQLPPPQKLITQVQKYRVGHQVTTL